MAMARGIYDIGKEKDHRQLPRPKAIDHINQRVANTLPSLTRQQRNQNGYHQSQPRLQFQVK